MQDVDRPNQYNHGSFWLTFSQIDDDVMVSGFWLLRL